MYAYLHFLTVAIGAITVVVSLMQLMPNVTRWVWPDPLDRPRTLHRDAVVSSALGASLIVGGAVLHPVRWWQDPESASLRHWLSSEHSAPVLLGCLAYLAIVLQTNRVLISLPRYRLIQARHEELRCYLDGLPDTCSSERNRLRNVVGHALAAAGVRIWSIPVWAPLPSVARATRMMNAVELQIMLHLSGKDLDLFIRQVAGSLSRHHDGADQAATILALVNGRQTGEADLRSQCATGLTMLDDLRDRRPQREAQEIGIALWLTMVGLVGVWLVSLRFDHAESMLLGALGGLLGSLAAVLLGDRKLAMSMILLSPVAGALNAVGGLLLVGFLARDDIQILGSTFHEVWAQPSGEISLAVALLLGVSGGLFTKLVSAGLTPLASALSPRAEPVTDSLTDGATSIPPGTATTTTYSRRVQTIIP